MVTETGETCRYCQTERPYSELDSEFQPDTPFGPEETIWFCRDRESCGQRELDQKLVRLEAAESLLSVAIPLIALSKFRTDISEEQAEWARTLTRLYYPMKSDYEALKTPR